MRLLAVALACGACGGKAAPAPSAQVDNTGGDAPAGPVYAGMFVEGARWTFDVHTLDDNLSDTSPTGFETTEEDLQATCHVEQFARFGDVTVIELVCDDTWPQEQPPLVGVWAMDPRGLWSLADWPGDEAPALDGKPTIASPPVAWREEDHDDAGELVSTYELAEEDGAWCLKSAVTQGDSAWDTVCFDGGPARGDRGWSGAEEHSYTFTLAD